MWSPSLAVMASAAAAGNRVAAGSGMLEVSGALMLGAVCFKCVLGVARWETLNPTP